MPPNRWVELDQGLPKSQQTRVEQVVRYKGGFDAATGISLQPSFNVRVHTLQRGGIKLIKQCSILEDGQYVPVESRTVRFLRNRIDRVNHFVLSHGSRRPRPHEAN